MANVVFNREIFEKEIGKLDEKMKERISMFGTPLEKVYPKEIEIEIFPNRPDLLSYSGFKRAFLAFLSKKPKIKKYKLNKPEKDYKINIKSSVSNIRPYTVCSIVKGLKLNEEKIKEIINLQEKLHITIGRNRKKCAIGIYPLDKITLPIEFKAIKPDKIKFIPLESEKEMSGLEILQRHPTGKKYAHLLAGKSEFPIFVDSKNNILSMPPIINSKITGKINEKTKNVFIECSGSNLLTLNKCLNILVTTLSDMGGEIYQMELNYKNKEITPNLDFDNKKINIPKINELLGVDINEKNLEILLKKMGYDYDHKTNEVKIPPWRNDILHEVDIIEDIAIAYGYENIIPQIPSIFTIGKEKKSEIIKSKISEILIGLKFLEVSNYHLISKNNQFKKMNLLEKNERNKIEIKESKTDYVLLRKDLSPYLLKNLSENIHSEYPQKIFEVGKVFDLNNSGQIIEKNNLAIAIIPGNFTELKQIAEYLFRIINFKINIKEPEIFPNHFIEGRIGEIISNKKLLGYIGEIHPKILKNWKLKLPVSIIEINIDEILNN
jgi:phenylalanyl-tRNA synthetase beta chain